MTSIVDSIISIEDDKLLSKGNKTHLEDRLAKMEAKVVNSAGTLIGHFYAENGRTAVSTFYQTRDKLRDAYAKFLFGAGALAASYGFFKTSIDNPKLESDSGLLVGAAVGAAISAGFVIYGLCKFVNSRYLSNGLQYRMMKKDFRNFNK